jgi:hypothetical protein
MNVNAKGQAEDGRLMGLPEQRLYFCLAFRVVKYDCAAEFEVVASYNGVLVHVFWQQYFKSLS